MFAVACATQPGRESRNTNLKREANDATPRVCPALSFMTHSPHISAIFPALQMRLPLCTDTFAGASATTNCKDRAGVQGQLRTDGTCKSCWQSRFVSADKSTCPSQCERAAQPIYALLRAAIELRSPGSGICNLHAHARRLRWDFFGRDGGVINSCRDLSPELGVAHARRSGVTRANTLSVPPAHPERCCSGHWYCSMIRARAIVSCSRCVFVVASPPARGTPRRCQSWRASLFVPAE